MMPSGQHGLSGIERRNLDRLEHRRGPAVAGPRTEGPHVGADGLQRADPEGLAHLVGQQVKHPVIAHGTGRQCRLEGPDPALPVDEGAGLFLVGSHRQHHIGHVGDGTRSQLQGDHEAPGQGVKQVGRADQVCRVDAADQQATEPA